MEKFSTWRDKGTGISPFLPVEVPVLPFNKYLVRPFRLLLKWPVFMVIYALSLIVPKNAIKAIFYLLISVSDIDISVEGVRQLKKSDIYAKQPDLGDVVISNLVSPLDILVQYLISKVNSVSQIAVIIPIKEDLFSFSVWQALQFCFLPVGAAPKLGTRVTDTLKTHTQGKLVIYFAEGTPTNNKAILPLSPLTNVVLELSKSVKVSVLRYYPGSVTLPIPHIGPKTYISKLMAAGSRTYVKVKIVPLEDLSPKACQRAFTENGLSQVELSVRDKEDFFKYYQDYGLEKITKR